MGYLKKNKKMYSSENRDKTVATRLSAREFEDFLSLCEETGYSVAEAMRGLILNELRDDVFRKKHEETNVNIMYTNEDEEETERNIPRAVRNPKTKFSTTKWNVDGRLPCPICEEWSSASNFARHAKVTHEMTTKELFQTYGEKADEMLEEETMN